jgi:hypothetical protein
VRTIRRGSLLAGVAGMALMAGAWCGAQQAPAAAVTVHVTTAKKVVLRHASIGIAVGAGAPFSFYTSDVRGNVTLSLAPGGYDLRVDVRGYPMTYEHVDVSAAATIAVVLGHGTAAKPAQAVAGPPTVATPHAAPAMKATAAKRRNAASAANAAKPSSSTDPLEAYTSCYFADGLQVQSVEPLAANVTSRNVDTADGTQQIDLVAGKQVLLAYPFTDFFANVRAEELPADRYAAQKAALVANLAYMESQPGGPEKAQALPSDLHGFDVYGNNRTRLEGSVLGMYLLFDDAAHVATTISFLNQESWRRKFQTMDDYARLRDQFLTKYTGCVRENQAIGR